MEWIWVEVRMDLGKTIDGLKNGEGDGSGRICRGRTGLSFLRSDALIDRKKHPFIEF